MTRRPVLLALVAVALCGAGAPLWNPRDFVEYWSAARAHLSGGNPYSGEELLPLQLAAGRWDNESHPVMLWTPPWTLPLYWPAGALPPREGHLLWEVAQLGFVLLAAAWLWRDYGGPRDPILLAAAPFFLALVFAPTWWMLRFGQNTGLLVLGLAGFVRAWKRGRLAEAGLWAGLTAVKPHLLALWGLCLVLDGVAGKSRRSLAYGVGAVAAFGGLALIPDPDIYAKYVGAMTAPPTPEVVPVSWWAIPTLGYRLRMLMTDGVAVREHTAVGFAWQFVPLMLAVPATVVYWWRRRAAWDWGVETPRLVAASALAAPYGAWIFDLVVLLAVLLPAAARAAARRPEPMLAACAVLVLLAMLIAADHPLLVQSLHNHVWVTPAVVALALILAWMARRGENPPAAE